MSEEQKQLNICRSCLVIAFDEEQQRTLQERKEFCVMFGKELADKHSCIGYECNCGCRQK